tara:strand:- start:902 stop:1570 length:669 start_codon:yes stop_codon:yes gene_type:complete
MKIIVSLENEESFRLAEKLAPHVDGFKINHILWQNYRGFHNFEWKKKEVFVDFKLWDTPNTVVSVVEKLIENSVTMTTISTFNNEQVFTDLQQFKSDIKLLGVTYLTSWSGKDQYDITKLMPDQMWEQALRRIKGFHGLICSPHDLKDIDYIDFYHDFQRVCPGIGNNTGQVRTTTPQEAFQLGADYIILGRLVTNSPNPIQTLTQIHKEINESPKIQTTNT